MGSSCVPLNEGLFRMTVHGKGMYLNERPMHVVAIVMMRRFHGVAKTKTLTDSKFTIHHRF